MTKNEARRVSELLVTLEDVKDWVETFEGVKDPFIEFQEITATKDIHGNGEHQGYEGQLRMSRLTAIAMMRWLERKTAEELESLGVEGVHGP